jgi:hypothetical protein
MFLTRNASHKTNSKNHITPIVFKTLQKPIGESAKALKLSFYASGL